MSLILLLLRGELAQADTPPQYAFSIGSSQIPGGIWPVSLGMDGRGNLHVASLASVVRLATNGAFLSRWGTAGTAPGQFTYAGPIAFDHLGNVYVADSYHDRIEKFDGQGNFLTTWGSTGGNPAYFSYPDGLGLNGADRVYVADFYNNRIQQFSPNGVYLGAWGSTGTNAGQFANPESIAIDSSNNVYVTDAPGISDNFRVQKFSPTGAFLSQWNAFGTNSQSSIEIGGAVTDAGNHLYVVDTANNRVQKFGSDGTFLAQWGSAGAGPGQFNGPRGIALDPSGNFIYVADYYNARIEVFAYAALQPVIFQPPTNQLVAAGSTLALSVGVFGAEPLAYQWQCNGADVPGATSATLIISNAPLSAAGSYSVVVTNLLGGAGSASAAISVVPLAVTTMPASAIAAASAVLNGSASLGPNPSLSWFEWGTDTAYGNRVGFTNLAANQTVALSCALIGLSGAAVCHYRLVGSNVLGLGFGSDAQFQVGLAPTVLTLPVRGISSSAVVLNASITPNGRATSSYFRWGNSTVYGHFTTTNQLGFGLDPFPAQTQIAGLVAGVVYHFQAVASNELGVILGNDVSFVVPPWVLAPPPPTVWNSLADSADGSRLAATAAGNRIYTSSDAGLTWKSNNAPAAAWVAITMSADGNRIFAVAGGPGPAGYSTNFGANWFLAPGPQRNWYALAGSADGLRLAATDGTGARVLISTNGGFAWTTNTPPTAAAWSAIASSASGQVLAVASGGITGGAPGPLFTSTNGGASWVSNNLPIQNWIAVAVSADGGTMLAAVGGGAHSGPIFISTNAGSVWSVTTASIDNWAAVTASADGSQLAAVPLESNSIYTSKDGGQTWLPQLLAPATRLRMVSSADGALLFLAAENFGALLRSVPAPRLAAAWVGSGLRFSWVVPSAPFVLQRSPGLAPAQWSNLPDQPNLNLTNLNWQVTVPAAGPSGFYRLGSP